MSNLSGPGQLKFRDYVLGDGISTFMEKITGWEDLPGIDSGTSLRPNSHGAWVGRKLAGTRIITWEGRFSPPDKTLWTEEISKLRSAFSLPLDYEEHELSVRTHDEVLQAYGSVINRAIPVDREYGYHGAKVVVQFECSDPRRYRVGENIWPLSLPPSVETGLVYPLSYPLDYGIESNSSSGTLVNDGDVSTPVILDFVGPAVNPAVISLSLGVKLKFNITLSASDVLRVDTREGTALLNGVADRIYTRTSDSAPLLSFGLKPGENDMQIIADSWDQPAGVIVSWRDAIL